VLENVSVLVTVTVIFSWAKAREANAIINEREVVSILYIMSRV